MFPNIQERKWPKTAVDQINSNGPYKQWFTDPQMSFNGPRRPKKVCLVPLKDKLNT